MDFSAIKKEESIEIRVSLRLEDDPSICRENERCSTSLSLSSSNGICNRECGSDRMVKTELEAALALTDLAELALSESANPNRDEKWGNKGRRSRKRLKNEARKRGLEEGVPELRIEIWTPQQQASHLVQVISRFGLMRI